MHASLKYPASAAVNPIGYRLRLEMKKQDVSSAELAKRADVKTSFIYDVISGKSTHPSTVRLARVATALGIPLSHLVGNHETGDAVMISGNTDTDEYIDVPSLALELAAKGGSAVIAHRQDEAPQRFCKRWISERLHASPEDMRLFHVDGDSMEPALHRGDSLMIDTSKKTSSPAGLFVIFDGFGLAVKRLEYLSQHTPPRIRIISDNPQYSTYERTTEETSIIGRVVWFARET